MFSLQSSLRQASLRASLLRTNSVMGSLAAANFAKFDRSKPHLNVGTIGKCPDFPLSSEVCFSLSNPEKIKV
jgi:hypothetical protein